MPADAPYVAVVDGVPVPRHSQQMPGTAWLKAPRTPPWKPGPHRAQRFAHLAGLLPLRWEPAFPPKAVPAAAAPRTQWQAALAEIAWLRAQLDATGRREQRLLVLGDGDYDVAGLWAGLPAGATLMTRCARNRARYALPAPEQRRGAPRTYGPRARRPPAWLRARAGWQRAQLPVRGRTIPVRYRVAGPFVVKGAPAQPVFLLVVPGIDRRARRLRRDPAYWLVTAAREGEQWVLPLPAEELLAWAWQRWEVEVCHRELKSGFGLGEVQCWNPTSAVLAVQWQAWADGVLVLAGYRAWGLTGAPLRPPALWWRGARRWSLGTLWRGYRQALWGATEFRALWTGTGAEWGEKATWLGGLGNAVAGSLRA